MRLVYCEVFFGLRSHICMAFKLNLAQGVIVNSIFNITSVDRYSIIFNFSFRQVENES